MTTLGIPLGAAVIVGAWILTAVYIVWANRYYDPEAQRLRRDAPDSPLITCPLFRDVTRKPDGLGRRVLSPHRRADAGDHLVGGAAHALDERVLRRRPIGLRAPERPGARGRLHERGVVPRHRGAGRAARLRRHDLRDRLARRLAGADVPHRRAAAQPRQVHVCRRRRVPPAAGAGAHRVGVRRHPDGALLHHRADGRRRQPDQAAVRHPLRVGGDRRRRRHAGLRALRRHDRDDVGADHQGRAAALRRDGADGAGARAVRLLAGEPLRGGRRRATVRPRSSLAAWSPIRSTPSRSASR